MSFLESEAKKLPVKVIEGRLSWNESGEHEVRRKDEAKVGEGKVQGGIIDRTPRLIDVIYLDRELSTSVTISKAEANLLRYHISQLDAEIMRLNKIKRLLQVIVVILALISIVSILKGFLRF
ncbi:hypothetical protein KEJ19_03240 [Candidatus Bathyarchaeota archaeon]|nr:hypothetical protein [Candidatus Bathyarchaeota archaeon]